MSQTGPRVAVVGSGAWGTTMAAHIGRREPGHLESTRA